MKFNILKQDGTKGSSITVDDSVFAIEPNNGVVHQAVVTELQGEKIDIVPWSEDQATYVVNSLAPAKISKVIFEEGTNRNRSQFSLHLFMISK